MLARQCFALWGTVPSHGCLTVCYPFPVDRYSGCFQYIIVMNKAAMTTGYPFRCECMPSFVLDWSWGWFPCEKRHTVTKVTFPLTLCENSGCSVFLVTLGVVRLFNFSLKLYLVSGDISL